MLLPLPVIGWVFTLMSIVALALGAVFILTLHRAGQLERRYLATTVLNDTLLFAIWTLGLAGGIGVLRTEPWGRHLLEFFCWTLIVLVLLSAATRVRALKQDGGPDRVNWLSAIAGLFVIAVPMIGFCAAAIITLRSDAAQQVFGG